MNKLPPLPAASVHRVTWDDEPGWSQYHDEGDPLPSEWDSEPPDEVCGFYSLSQLQADRLAVWNAALKAAAKVCESVRDKALGAQHGNPDDLQNVMLRQVAIVGAGDCAFAIRLLEETN